MPSTGARRNPSAPQVDARILETLRGIAVALLSDNLHRGVGSVGLQPYHRSGAIMAGTAVTVRSRGGDNLTMLRAYEYCRPGDVMVIDCGGDVTNAVLGGILSYYGATIGLSGMVLDAPSATWRKSASVISRSMRGASTTAAPTRTARARSTCRYRSAGWW